MLCNLRQIKDFILYYLFKMQPNALLIRQNFIVVKSGCYMCVGEELLPLSSDADVGYQWDVQTDEG
jgi:hypothetical protein